MEEEVTISVLIADRPYRLKIGKEEEESVKKAVTLIEQKIREYSGHYAFKDRQDLLAMVALQFTTSYVNTDQKTDRKEPNIERLKQLDELLSKHLHTQ
jgi:cell division protein ZapA (FtsZ GTPase activity inhibitor)